MLNTAAIDRLLHGSLGPVDLDMRRRAENVKTAAETIIAETFNVRTGNLLRSLRVLDEPTGGKRILCDPDVAPYAGYLDHGTEPHPITARRTRYLVSEPNNPTPLIGDDIVAVEHPGNPAFNFMHEALKAFKF